MTALNGASTGWSYDADGNETAGNSSVPRTSETYTATNALSSITTGGSATAMTYNSSGNTLRVASGGISCQDGPEGIASQTVSGTTTDFTRDPSGTLVSERVGGSSYYYLYDAQGSVIGVVNASGTQVDTYSYDPYGVLRTHTGTQANPFGYIAGYADATGVTKLGARYYDSSIGRFTQQDPSAQEANLYQCAEADPVNNSDPSGLLVPGFSSCGEEIAVGVAIEVDAFASAIAVALVAREALPLIAAAGEAVTTSGIIAAGVYLVLEGEAFPA